MGAFIKKNMHHASSWGIFVYKSITSKETNTTLVEFMKFSVVETQLLESLMHDVVVVPKAVKKSQGTWIRYPRENCSWK